ncbi:hypothetical protein H721_02480 [Brucella ovis IntaBari-2006-46-332]|nr:hypothetical protein C010_02647 [Brucella ovis 80/125]ENR06736.1 hypothetical protein C961_02357 [Brucella ovis F8/05B]ENS93367.1 hypothetical protein B999_02622 [Brucella ovis 63/96]ENS97832.1 hypothetical protein C009_02495 [Brucella ovis 81/8]ENT76167.1 hypothetical protein H712_02625 [Brucella ovis IntaBari-2009-88-4]ENT78410.1 hypothetical protein H720_02416 [Brucella ovis IntaBari-2006-46-348]ENT81959.1 hypothetical protein H713_02628 [Brucella ovis IntaBari-2010-47-268]ENT86551.1 h
MKQHYANLVFKITNLLAERGLADAKLCRRAREVSLFRHGQKITQMAQFHWYIQKLSQLTVSYIGQMKLIWLD